MPFPIECQKISIADKNLSGSDREAAGDRSWAIKQGIVKMRYVKDNCGTVRRVEAEMLSNFARHGDLTQPRLNLPVMESRITATESETLSKLASIHRA